MKNKKILTAIVLIFTLFGFVGSTSAHYVNKAPKNVVIHRTIINKLIDEVELSDEETEILEEIREMREEIRTIIDKEENEEELTEDEEEKLKEFKLKIERKLKRMNFRRDIDKIIHLIIFK